MINTVSLDRFTESKELVKIMRRFLALERLTHQIRTLVLVPYCCTSQPLFSASLPAVLNQSSMAELSICGK